MEAIKDWSLADVERMIGAPWSPPPADRPASRALYFRWISDRIAAATGEPCALQWLVAGGVPDPVDALIRETYRLRMARTIDELKELARAGLVQ